MSTPALLRPLTDPAVRAAVHAAVRRHYPGVTALCAVTASEFLLRAGLLTRRFPWTADLAAELRRRGWIMVAARAELRPGDLCFTVDANANGAPDHVYFFLRWLDRGQLVAEVVDNYAAQPAPRNVGPALNWTDASGRAQRLARGALAYALRAQSAEARVTVPVAPADATRIKAAFSVLYESWPQLSAEARERLNLLRRDPPFDAAA